MTAWTPDQLDTIARVDEIEISSRRPDGTLTTPRVIWAVRTDDEIYIRSVNGPTAAWYRATRSRHEGHLRVADVDIDVTFIDTDNTVTDRVDAAYRDKYRRYAASIIDSINSPRTAETTMRLIPR
ncbi:DUF2255 family protein [Nocardia macrotermitis]|uniref:DUF2255 family protein n=1 Tax=Nocardia macrotermitis TaxID=2585198 RepID=A0A7K0D499_9NOCA|nr:DUF2255 family protein [Nocardia macrotermitis]MQY20527.1 hypothetical protein [Nocardia macrotermitis]